MDKPKGVGIGTVEAPSASRYAARFPWAWERVCPDGTLKPSWIDAPGLLPDWAIREFVSITPWTDYGECPPGRVSYGLSSAGYDLRVGYRFKIFTNAGCATVDVKSMDPRTFVDRDVTPARHDFGPDNTYRQCVHCGADGVRHRPSDPCPSQTQPDDHVLIPPNSFALAETIETVHVPRNVCCICLGKSTYARAGVNMNFTPFEPGWHGVVTVEILNGTPLPVKIYAGEGIGQALFFLMAGTPERSYGEKPNAKYQDQKGLQLPTVR